MVADDLATFCAGGWLEAVLLQWCGSALFLSSCGTILREEAVSTVFYFGGAGRGLCLSMEAERCWLVYRHSWSNRRLVRFHTFAPAANPQTRAYYGDLWSCWSS